MSRKALWSLALLSVLVSVPAAMSADSLNTNLDRNALKVYANEIDQAFSGQVDIYLSRDPNYANPTLPDVRIVGCAQVAGTLYYVIEMPNKSESFVPQAQIVMIHKRK